MKSEPKALGHKVLKDLEPKVKTHSRQQTFKSKVLNWFKPFHMRENVQNKRKPSIINSKGPIRLWVTKSEIIFATNMLQRRSKAVVMVPGQWLLTTYDRRKTYVPNPNYGIWRKPKREDHWYMYYW